MRERVVGVYVVVSGRCAMWVWLGSGLGFGEVGRALDSGREFDKPGWALDSSHAGWWRCLGVCVSVLVEGGCQCCRG